MKKVLCIIAVLVVVVASAVSAAEIKGGDTITIPAGTTVADDLYAFAQTVDVSGKVVGDVISAARTVEISGDVTQKVMATGGDVILSGKTGDDIMAAGGDVRIAGSAVEDATVAGGTVEFQKGSKIGRDVLAGAGTVVLNGAVGRNAKVSAGEVRVDGTIGGSLDVQSDSLVIGPETVVKGDLIYRTGKKPEISPDAKIMGKTVAKPMPAKPKPTCGFGCKGGMWLAGLLMLLVAGLVVIALAPRAAEAAADAVFGKFWLSLLVGFLVLTVVPIALTIVMCTVVGLPLGLIFMAAYLIAVYLSRAFVALAIGRWLFRKRETVSPYLAFFVGLLILWVIMAIPIFGWIVNAVALMLGLGGLVMTRYSMMKQLRSEGRI